MSRKPKPKPTPDDPEEYKRFLETAKEVEADKDSKAFLMKVVPSSVPQKHSR